MVVALDHRRDRPKTLHCGFVERPHRIDDGFIMGIDAVIPEIAVAGQVELLYPLEWDVSNIGIRVKSMIEGADIDIVDIEQDQTIGLFSDSA